MTGKVSICWLCHQLAERTGLSKRDAGEMIRAAMIAGDLNAIAPRSSYVPKDLSQEIPVSDLGGKIAHKLSPKSWIKLEVDWDDRMACFQFTDDYGVYLAEELQIDTLKAYHFIRIFDPVLQVTTANKDVGSTSQTGMKKNSGVSSKINWEACLVEAARWMYIKGRPKTQVELFNYINDWLGPIDISLTQLKEHLTPLYKAFERADQSD